METTYALLNKDAKAWWYHAELRKNGNARKARELERRSIRHSIETLRAARQGGCMFVGRGGWSISYKSTHGDATLSGYGDGDPYATIVRRLGIPFIDSRHLAVDKVARIAISGPMYRPGETPSEPPYTSLSYAPLKYIADLYRDAGAIVENV